MPKLQLMVKIMETKNTPHCWWTKDVINQNGWDKSPKTNPHLFFLATRIIAPAPKIVIAI